MGGGKVGCQDHFDAMFVVSRFNQVWERRDREREEREGRGRNHECSMNYANTILPNMIIYFTWCSSKHF